MNELDAASLPDYLSGILIGHELASAAIARPLSSSASLNLVRSISALSTNRNWRGLDRVGRCDNARPARLAELRRKTRA